MKLVDPPLMLYDLSSWVQCMVSTVHLGSKLLNPDLGVAVECVLIKKRRKRE
jgi:hypothetical protein